MARAKPVDTLLPTTTVGALPRPAWYTYNLEGRDVLQALKNAKHREAFLDATRAILGDQEAAGLDVVTDGKMWYDEYTAGLSWIDYPLERIGGITGRVPSPLIDAFPIPSLRAVLQAALFQAPIVGGKLERGPLRFADMYRMVAPLTRRPVKIGLIDPTLLAAFAINKYYPSQRDLVFDLCRVYNEELRDLAAAGCPIVQLEDPAFIFFAITGQGGSKDAWEMAREAWNTTVEGVGSQVWLHLCWGSPAGQQVVDPIPSYAFMFPHILDFRLDLINIESASTGGADFDLFKEYPSDHLVGIGAISHRSVQIERAEQVAALVRKALNFVDADRLVVTTDCGLARQSITRLHALLKLRSLVEGTGAVRRELGA